MWKSLVEGRNFIKEHGRWTVGRGLAINAWKDTWISSGLRLTQQPHHHDLQVSDLLLPQRGGWNQPLITHLFPPQIASQILKLQLPGC